MSITLAIDTSTIVMGIAVTDKEKVIGEVVTNMKKNHSVRLMPAIHTLMEEVDISPAELNKIVVATGPGSYTGVRIAVTTAKTLAWSLSIPVVGVSSLAAMAQVGRYFQGVVVPIIDARRGQVYTGLYEWDGSAVCNIKEDRSILLTDWLQMVDKRMEDVLFIGQDVYIHRAAIEESLGSRALFAPTHARLTRPSDLAFLGNQEKDRASAHTLVPNYHRLAEAEVNWQKAQREKKNRDE